MARGDHVFYYRAGSVYSHHGIDCGDGSVIHFESSIWQKFIARAQPAIGELDEAMGTMSDRVGVPRMPSIVQADWAEFAQGAEVFVRVYDRNTNHDSQVVINRAQSRLGNTNYDLWGNNCEHFAVWCKTGIAESTQVRAVQEANRALWNSSPVTLTMLRVARRLPPHLRGLAYTGAAAVTGTAYLTTYLRHRYQQQRERLS